jgi:hypothetical protein
MFIKTPKGKRQQGTVETYGLGDRVTMYVVLGAEGPARLGGTLAVVQMTIPEAREVMAQIAKAVTP